MRQKTVWMSEDYVMEYSPADGMTTKWQDLKPGIEVILTERYWELEGRTEYELYLHNGQGIPGNMDGRRKCYHGWRGTTNNVARYAHGVRKIESVKPWKDGYRVRVGRDLHPEWD